MLPAFWAKLLLINYFVWTMQSPAPRYDPRYINYPVSNATLMDHSSVLLHELKFRSTTLWLFGYNYSIILKLLIFRLL